MAQNDIDALIAGFQNSDLDDIDDAIKTFEKKESDDKPYDKEPDIQSNKTEPESNNLYSKDKKVVDKLDEINRESEEKVNYLFEKLEAVGQEIEHINKSINQVKPYINKHKEFMDFFVEKFPKTVVKNNYDYFKNIINIVNDMEKSVSNIENNIFDSMDILQFQDITRQKIEKVISVIKTLHDYLDEWFTSSSIEDIPRARVANTIVDEKDKDEVDKSVDEIIEQMKREGEMK